MYGCSLSHNYTSSTYDKSQSFTNCYDIIMLIFAFAIWTVESPYAIVQLTLTDVHCILRLM